MNATVGDYIRHRNYRLQIIMWLSDRRETLTWDEMVGLRKEIENQQNILNNMTNFNQQKPTP